MTSSVTYKQFFSDKGFQSPGFLVDDVGNFSVSSLNATSSLKINNQEVLSSTTLANSVINSSLTTVGTLSSLTVNSTNDISLTTLTALNLTSNVTTINASTVNITSTGAVVLASGTTGNIDNMTIGLNTPVEAQFTTVTATENIFIGAQNVKALSAALAVALS